MWKELIGKEMQSTYQAVEGMIAMLDDNELDWKPESGKNWMTVGQLLHHIADACGSNMKSLATVQWSMPEGMDMSKVDPETHLPPADAYPSVKTIEQAKDLLAKDKKAAKETLEQCSEESLANDTKTVPWHQSEVLYGYRMMECIEHLRTHRSQLFFYLKLQGKSVNTAHLWGMQ